MVSVAIISITLMGTETSYDDYFSGAQFIHFLLGPATVALAIPLYNQLEQVKKFAFAILVSISTVAVLAAVSASFIAWYCGANRESVIAIAPKSITAAVG